MSLLPIPIVPEPGVLSRLDKSGPRYTSYPTADRFGTAFGPSDYRRALRQRALDQARGIDRGALSVYVHIPFCESVCYYCACNKVVTRNHGRAAPYLGALEQDLALHVTALGARQQASQLHLGGGTPTFLDDAELARLMAALRGAFQFSDDAEMSIEVDPRTVTPDRMAFLSTLGFNRLSLGVQDFDERVQAAVHRVQSFDSVSALVTRARELGFASVNVDLIYGLPMQTSASFERTITQVSQLRPDRIALYGYAHLPARFKPQRRIDDAALPQAGQRIGMLSLAARQLAASGYDDIGMDHFALPGDALAVAKREGRLHRNFQGYSTQPDCDIVALGVSAIGRVGDCYAQNAKTLDGYQEAVHAGAFATDRGLWLTRDDVLRRAVIMALMCQGQLDFDDIEQGFGISMAGYFGDELAALGELAEDGLVRIEPRAVQVTRAGWHVVRNVAMVFDRYVAQRDARQCAAAI